MNPAEAYILKQNEPYRSILLQLQSIIGALAPDGELLYKWRLPFYFANGIPLCFLNQSKDYVDLGFWHHDKMYKFNEDFVIYVNKKQLEINSNPYKLVRKS